MYVLTLRAMASPFSWLFNNVHPLHALLAWIVWLGLWSFFPAHVAIPAAVVPLAALLVSMASAVLLVIYNEMQRIKNGEG